MQAFFIRVVVYALAISLTAMVLPGITVANNDIWALLLIGLVFGLVNAFIRPIIRLLSCPFVLLTMGLFTLCINGFLLQLVAWVVSDRLKIDNFLWAIVGGIVMAFISAILERLFVPEKNSRKRK